MLQPYTMEGLQYQENQIRVGDNRTTLNTLQLHVKQGFIS